jgi:hypothetical protein
MKSNIFSWGKFKAVIPDNWVGEVEDGVNTLCEPIEGVGALQFSVFTVEDPSSVALKEDLADLLDNESTGEISLKNNCAQTIYLDESEDKYWKYWLIQKDSHLFFGTYNCNKKYKEIEASTVEEIINFIMIA